MSGDDIILPNQARLITADIVSKKADEAMALKKRKEDEAKHVQVAFMEREIHPDAMKRVSAAVRRAAERGEQQVLVVQFPSDWCSDRGRAINNADADWPKTLTGFAKRAFDYYSKELQPHGYGVRAEILNFPGGMPGDVGLFLTW